MAVNFEGALARVAAEVCGPERARAVLDSLAIDPVLVDLGGERALRAVPAMGLAVALFADLLDRAPSGRAYVEDLRACGSHVVLDHGALRTVLFPSGPTGAQPAGRAAFARLLEPLGYAVAGVYPLERLGMTGYAFAHRDFPEALPQYFVSELHVERFSDGFQRAARRVFGSTRESLGEVGLQLLQHSRREERYDEPTALAGLPQLVAAFERWHHLPTVDDYELLLAESPEAAWIATEGFVFNHAADRVPDVAALAAEQRALDRPIKSDVEISASGRVRQTAFRADPVDRELRRADGSVVTRRVPGSFFEFITREPLPEPSGRHCLDLSFDSANAQGIFAMTSTAVDRGSS